MHIQWYPGHMNKARKQIVETLPKVDLVIEILDARIPFSSENPLLAELRGDKPCIKILNKSDLADPAVTASWQQWLEREKAVKTMALDSTQKHMVKPLLELCRKMVPAKADISKPLSAMIFGIPNVGKSTWINILADRTIAKTGNEPAVTKNQQRIKLENNITLIDTPGMLWPNIEHPNYGYRLAATGAIKDTAIDHADVAFFIIDYLLDYYRELLAQRYQIDDLATAELEAIEQIGAKRGCLGSGGRVNLDQVAKILLTELRSGYIGNISLEIPEMIEQEEAEVIIKREQRAVKKEARKNKWKKNT